MECLAIINQKGGVGKTATTVNLGAAMAARGPRVLLIDLDPQGHLTAHLGLDGEAKGAGIYEVLTKNFPLDEAIHPYSPTLSVVPAQIELAAAETELISVVGREVLLRDTLSSQSLPFDIILIDCPPSLGILTLNALSAATRVVVPLQPHFLALQGVGMLFETISLVAQRINPGLTVLAMAMCMWEVGTRLSGEVVEDISNYLKSSRDLSVPWNQAVLLKSRVRRNVKLAECPSYGQSIHEYAPRCNGSIDYMAMGDEVLELLASDNIPEPIREPIKEPIKEPPPQAVSAPLQEVTPASQSVQSVEVPSAGVQESAKDRATGTSVPVPKG